MYQLETERVVRARIQASSWRARIKRALDLILATIGIVLLSPFFVLIALLIKTTSRGPVFYVDKRLGLNGEPFGCYKFRTMIVGAEEKLQELLQKDPALREEYEATHKLRNDPRVTQVGRFLRRFSLDELPQLFNVLKGEMSIVGPRPYLVRELEDMGHFQPIICTVRPGITGLWQVSGRSNCTFDERLRIESGYVDQWSFKLDFQILIRTFSKVVSRDGAY